MGEIQNVKDVRMTKCNRQNGGGLDREIDMGKIQNVKDVRMTKCIRQNGGGLDRKHDYRSGNRAKMRGGRNTVSPGCVLGKSKTDKDHAIY